MQSRIQHFTKQVVSSSNFSSTVPSHDKYKTLNFCTRL